MTLEEASAKWCPFTRAHWSGGVESEYQGNRFFTEDGKTSDRSTACLGSGCMAWRWNYSEGMDVDFKPTEGHCGLAGDE